MSPTALQRPGDLFAQRADARSRVALAVSDAERWRYEERRADVAVRVIVAYLDCYYLERAIEITERSMQLVEYVEEVLRCYRSGEQSTVI